MREIDCAQVEQEDLIALYLAGRLAEGDAEAFERHQLGCDRCSAELAQAGEIRAALGQPLLVPAVAPPQAPRFSGRDVGTLLAAAAAVAMVALGIRELVGRPEFILEHVYRGSEVKALLIEARREPGAVRLSWASVEDAQAYVVEVVASDGSHVLKREISERTFAIDVSALPSLPGVSFLARVRAIDPMGQVIARGERTLPRR